MGGTFSCIIKIKKKNVCITVGRERENVKKKKMFGLGCRLFFGSPCIFLI